MKVSSIMNTSEFNERGTVIGIPEMLLWKTFYLLVGFKAFAKESASGVKPMSQHRDKEFSGAY